MLQEKHQEEVTVLKKRLKWYAENQELLDKDAARLRAATAETQRLTLHVGPHTETGSHSLTVEKLKTEFNRRANEQQKKAKERAGEAKRVQDLERQLQYKQQISDLEQCLAKKSQNEHTILSEESESQTHWLKIELGELKKEHQKQESALQAEVASLREKLHQAQALTQSDKPARSPFHHQLQVEAAQATRIEKLIQDLCIKSHTIQELSRTVECLQRERRTMLSAPGFDQTAMEAKRNLDVAKEAKRTMAETFSPTQDEKEYHPGAFAGLHISEVQLENGSVWLNLEQLEIRREQDRVSLQAAVSQAQSQLQRVQGQNA